MCVQDGGIPRKFGSWKSQQTHVEHSLRSGTGTWLFVRHRRKIPAQYSGKRTTLKTREESIGLLELHGLGYLGANKLKEYGTIRVGKETKYLLSRIATGHRQEGTRDERIRSRHQLPPLEQLKPAAAKKVGEWRQYHQKGQGICPTYVGRKLGSYVAAAFSNAKNLKAQSTVTNSLHSVAPSAEPATWVDVGRPLPTRSEVASTDSADYGRPRSTDLNPGKQTLPT
ncbi:hypothetical protein B0H13DRAFT_2428017 [Mycena leptocephala]|nr:hypothetical protein B0H13DRAFT_2428017 [Mycena leptocephala]